MSGVTSLAPHQLRRADKADLAASLPEALRCWSKGSRDGIRVVGVFSFRRTSGSTYVEFVLVSDRSGFSVQTLSVLAALCERPSRWCHGYALARQTGLKSGTLYPILMRLADRGWLEASWEDEQPAGRPRRHLYRLTSEGVARSSKALAAAPAPARTARKPRGTVGRIAPEGM